MTDSINPATHRPPAKSLSEQYGKRLDLYLPTLQGDAARFFYLKKMDQHWQNQMRRFIETEGASHPKDPQFGWPRMSDFSATISEIQIRMDRYAPAKEAA